jgi:phage-related protein
MPLTDIPLEFVGSSRDDLSGFPNDVKRSVGLALRTAQKGGKHPDAKPLKGFKGAGVLEIISDFDGNTFGAVYTVRFRSVIYVLHAFQKKSRKGIKTPQNEIEKIKSRLKVAESLYQTATEKQK